MVTNRRVAIAISTTLLISLSLSLSLQKYAKDSQEKTDTLLALDVPISPTVTNEKMGGRWGGPTETRFDKVGVVPPPRRSFCFHSLLSPSRFLLLVLRE